MPAKKPQPDPSQPVVLRRYRAAGEARELGIASVPHGGIVVEHLDDGSFRLAPDQEASLFDAASESVAVPVAPAEPESALPAPREEGQ